jgi:ATP-dependent DNA ligase
VDLPVQPPVAPMLAKPAAAVPDPAGWPDGLGYEPKWDGFRCVVFRDGPEVVLGSRNERPLTRYFPELVEGLLRELPPRCVLDGEIVVAVDGRLDFPRLQERIHPAASRVAMLAERQPAAYVAFDLLALGDRSLLTEPFAQRRRRLEEAVRAAGPPVHLTPLTTDPQVAREWFVAFEGAGLDGVVAKPRDLPYRPDQRVMIKVKHARTADVVVAGYRLHKSSTQQRPLLGSLLLGLYDDQGTLQHVGVAGAFATAVRAQLHDLLQPLRAETGDHPWAGWSAPDPGGQRRPGAVSRWNTGKDLSFVPLRPELVCEVGYDAMEGTRFRHTAQFRRWRPDRTAVSCGYDQLERPVSMTLEDLLARGGPRTGAPADPGADDTSREDA